MKREREGGGLRSRMGIFTIDNLQAMLRNRAYMGVKVFTHKGRKQEVEAAWPAIIDRDTFLRVNEVLDKNKRSNKNTMENRYPFLLSGLVSCKTCGDRLVGKSAHGRREKIPYYENAWATRKGLVSQVSSTNASPIGCWQSVLSPWFGKRSWSA
ncbi:MAG: recombinase family protein [Bdellovibrionales bacterium]